jgi:hypothetical protein
MSAPSAPGAAADWVDLPAVPESRLGPDLRARLLAGEGSPPPPPPWRTQVAAVVWWHRADPAARDQLPEAVRHLPSLPLTVGALVRYRDSPVGSYSEVFASPVLLRGRGRPGLPVLPAITVPFIAVDSWASVVGGRAGWMLPKTLARALWPPHDPARLETDGWSVAASVAPRGPQFPLAGILPLLQAQPDGSRRRSTVRMRGRARFGRVEIATSGPSLPAWLRAGVHPCLAISSGRMLITAPEAERRRSASG